MNKEKILAMSRKENKNRDLEYMDADKNAGAIAYGIAAIIAAILFFTEIFVTGEVNASLWIVMAVMGGVYSLFMYLKLKTTKHLILSIMFLTVVVVVAAVALWAYLL